MWPQALRSASATSTRGGRWAGEPKAGLGQGHQPLGAQGLLVNCWQRCRLRHDGQICAAAPPAPNNTHLLKEEELVPGLRAHLEPKLWAPCDVIAVDPSAQRHLLRGLSQPLVQSSSFLAQPLGFFYSIYYNVFVCLAS